MTGPAPASTASMRPLASCTNRGRRLGALAFAALVATVGPAGVADAAVLRTQEEALAEAFPDARVEKETVFLGEEQAAEVARLAGSPPGTRVVVRYHGARGGERVGTAYFDVHPVRTLPKTLLIVIGPDGTVRKVEVLSFEEPRDYLPRERWFDQFTGRALDDELSLKRGIRGVTGATLSSRAVTAAVRRALATHRVIGDGREPAMPPARPPQEHRP